MVGVVLLSLAIGAVLGVVQVVGGWAISAVAPGGNDPLVGCWLNEQGTLDALQTATAQSQQVIGKVRLGDQKATVLSILSVPENTLQPYYYYLEEGSELIEFFTLRTHVMLDGCMTDDELTPFIFRDGILVSIGWRTLSGPHSFGTPHIENSHGNTASMPN